MIELLPEAKQEALFPQEIAEPEGGFRTVIVGGGLAGILTALRLSRDPERVSQGILLLEGAPALGGRLFFACPGAGRGGAASPRDDFSERLGRVRGQQVSGFGLEILGGDVAEILERHVRSTLSEEESGFLDAATLVEAQPQFQQKSFVLRKESTPWEALLRGPSEILTRKDAAELAELLESPSPEKLKSVLGREALVPLLETVVRRDVAGMPPQDVLTFLSTFSQRHAVSRFPATLMRSSGFELACELLLRARGVQVRTRCRVTRVMARANHSFAVSLADPFCRSRREVTGRAVVLALPLMSCFALLPRDHFSGNQSRGILKHPPSSLVAAEYGDLERHALPDQAAALTPGSHLLFPGERTQGFVSSARQLILHSYLDYEQSLDAPKVREAVSRMRRAAERVLRQESLQGLAGQALVRGENLARERVVLLPVARYLESPGVTLRDVRMGVKGLYCCGDNFTFDALPWQNVVASVQELVTLLSKG